MHKLSILLAYFTRSHLRTIGTCPERYQGFNVKGVGTVPAWQMTGYLRNERNKHH